MTPPPSGDVFARASFRLAALFAVIVVLLILVSGLVLYRSISIDLQNAIAHTPVSGETEQERVNQSVSRLRLQLIVIDGIAILAVGGVGLWYARRTLRPVRETYAAQKRFIADASHELRTPLAIMQADFEVSLRGAEVEDSARPVLESGLEEVARMSAIVDDLLLLSRIDAHQEELTLKDLDLGALVRAAVEPLRALAEREGVQLAVAAPDGAASVSADSAHLERAVRNVVKNAVEASPHGGTVTVRVTAEGGQALVSVVDEGPGMTPSQAEHVFDRFYRIDAARSSEGGSGLGLSIVDWTVRAHGGEARVSSAGSGDHHGGRGGGTLMTIALPLSKRP
jgi:two-component system OmpR family sensor kinase